MTKIVLTDGTEEFLSPGAARKKVSAGEAVFAQATPMYSTRQMVADVPVKVKAKRKVKAKVKVEADTDED